MCRMMRNEKYLEHVSLNPAFRSYPVDVNPPDELHFWKNHTDEGRRIKEFLYSSHVECPEL
jgi:hypothetical protein